MPIPPPPPFWPEKATEWVALVGGTLGGVLGTFAFVLSILNYRRDRPKIRLRLKPHMRLAGDPIGDYLVLLVANEGRREVQATHAIGQYYNGDAFTFPDLTGPVLSEKSPNATFVVKEDSLSPDLWYVYVAAPVREYRVYVDPLPKRWWRALRAWPERVRKRRDLRERRKNRLSSEIIALKPAAEPDKKPSRLTVQESRAQRMERLGPLLAAVSDVLKHVHHYRQRFTNTFDHHNILQRKPDPPLYAGLEAAALIASKVSVKAHQHVAEAITSLKALDRLQQEVGASLKNSVGRGLAGAAADAVQRQAEEECNHLEFYLKPVREEIERMLSETSD